jgi:hypothetical protein
MVPYFNSFHDRPLVLSLIYSSTTRDRLKSRPRGDAMHAWVACAVTSPRRHGQPTPDFMALPGAAIPSAPCYAGGAFRSCSRSSSVRLGLGTAAAIYPVVMLMPFEDRHVCTYVYAALAMEWKLALLRLPATASLKPVRHFHLQHLTLLTG